MKILTYVMFAALLTNVGCFRTQITFGDPKPGVVSREWDERWYHDFVFGLAEASGPIMLDSVCPMGVARIEQRTSFLNGLVQDITSDLYNPQLVTIYCKAGHVAELELAPTGEVVALHVVQ